MSTADQYPGPAPDPDVTPWGVPVSVPPTQAPGGHLPSFGMPPAAPGQPAPAGPPAPPFSPGQSATGFPQAPQYSPPFAAPQSGASFTQFPGVQAEPESHMTQVPLPPAMQSPYGAPLQQPRLLLDPRPDAKNEPGDAHSAKRRKTLIASSLAAVAVVGVGAAVALMPGTPQKTAALADTAHDASATPSGSPTSAFTGKPDGDTQAGAVQAGAVVPTADPSSVSGSPVPGQPVPSSSGAARKPAGGATHTTTGAPAGTTAQPSAGMSANPPASAPGGTTAKPPTATTTTPKAPVTSTTATSSPPSTDCTYLDLPAAKMPVISQSSPGSAAAVKQLQCLMKKSELGIKPLAIDGVWGPDTQSALIAFEQCNNAPTVHSPGGNPPYARLTVNGVANQQTWADLYFWDAQYFNGVSYYCNGTR